MPGPRGIAPSAGGGGSGWLGGLHQLPTVGRHASRVWSRELPVGVHGRLDELVMRRGKARLRIARGDLGAIRLVKVEYLQGIATALLERRLDPSRWPRMHDGELV